MPCPDRGWAAEGGGASGAVDRCRDCSAERSKRGEGFAVPIAGLAGAAAGAGSDEGETVLGGNARRGGAATRRTAGDDEASGRCARPITVLR